MRPQFFRAPRRVRRVRRQPFGLPPPPQLPSVPHEPQSSTAEHSSETKPQFMPLAEQVVGAQVMSPHRLGPPPPHAAVPAQVPHSMVAPQPSRTVPQFFPAALHVVWMHGGLGTSAP